MQEVFCIDCDYHGEPKITVEKATRMYHGMEITFDERSALCPNCGRGFIHPDAHDVNLKTLQVEWFSRISHKDRRDAIRMITARNSAEE